MMLHQSTTKKVTAPSFKRGARLKLLHNCTSAECELSKHPKLIQFILDFFKLNIIVANDHRKQFLATTIRRHTNKAEQEKNMATTEQQQTTVWLRDDILADALLSPTKPKTRRRLPVATRTVGRGGKSPAVFLIF